MGVPSINKPNNTPCSKLCATGCSIYTERPQECCDFECLWLQDDGHVFRNMQRPDHIGVIFDVTGEASKIGRQALVAHAVWPGALEAGEAKKLVEKYAARGILVICIDGDKRSYVGPEHLITKVKQVALEVRKSAVRGNDKSGDPR